MSNGWGYSSYSKIDSEVEKYFPFKKPRKDQLETISEIKEAIDKGYKFIVLEAGTGTGKSAIAATLASIYESTYILTVTKQLQDQYIKDFKDLGFKLVKGRGNFKCKKYLEDNLDLNCDEGRCVIEGYRCEYSLNRNHDNISKENTCHYFYQKFVAMHSDVVISNYPYMFLELNYVEDFKNRRLMIFDEAHNLENVVMSQLKLEFKRKELKEYVGINLSSDVVAKLEFGDYTDWIRFIKRVRDKYSRELNKIKNLKGKTGINEKISFLKLRISDCNRFIDHIQHDPSKWIFDYDKRFGVAEFKPIKVDNYARNNFFEYGDVCLFMSATILDYKLFAEWLGIDENEIYAIRRESPFKVDRNPIITFSDFDMNYGKLSESAPKTINTINKILEVHKKDKGVIHTISHQCKEFLKKNIDSERLIDHNTSNRAVQLEKFKNSDKPLVLVSPSMNEGVDLPGDECRFQIIYKIPYPSLGNKQTRLRKNLDNQWYDYKTCLSLVQTYGRGMRYEQDFCKTYFIDSRLKGFITRDLISNNFLPRFFIKAVDITPAVIDTNEKVEFESVELKEEFIKEEEDFKLDEENSPIIEEIEIKKVDDNLSYVEKCDLKYDLTVKGKKLLKEDISEAIKFYNNLLHHELFIHDYHPYLKLSKAYREVNKYNEEVELLTKFLKSGIYCRKTTLNWFKKRLKQLHELGYYDISQLNELEREYKHHGNKNRKLSKIPVPFAKDIESGRKNINKNPIKLDSKIFDDFVKLDDDMSYEDKMHFKYLLILKGDELMSSSEYVTAIAYYNRLLSHDLFINDYHPYLKLSKAYRKDKQKDGEIEILKRFFESGVYCGESKLKWFLGRLKHLSNYGHFDPSKIPEFERKYYENGALNESISNTPVPMAFKIRKMFESGEIEIPKVDYETNLNPKKYSQEYFYQLADEIKNQPGYESYLKLTKHNDNDYISFENYELVDKKADLKNKGLSLESTNYEEAIDFYDDLKKNELFINDYYPYRRQCILLKNYTENNQREWNAIIDLFTNGVYLNRHQYIWLNNKIIELISKLKLNQLEINKINSLLNDYEINKNKYELIQNQPVLIAERIFKDENGLKVLSKEKYNYIENIHYINELGNGYIKRGEFEIAIAFYNKLSKQKLPYFKYQAYNSFARILKEMGNFEEFKRLYQKYEYIAD